MTESHDAHHESNLAANVVLFIFTALLIAFVSYEIKKIIRIPVSPILLLMGLLFKVCGQYISYESDAVSLVDKLDPHVINFVILPPLIFEAALATDWHSFKKVLGQIIPMATTMVILSSFITAAAIKYLLGYDFTWSEAILLGIVLSATDHVAVVAQLKEIYANERLETLISGETLLNEAMVIMLFKVVHANCLGLVEIQSNSLIFIRLTVGGLLLGLLFSVIMAWSIKRITNDTVQETNLTLITTYLIFYIADGTSVEVSGALAIVTFGLFMSAYGKTLISPAVEESLHAFWKIIATNVESLVFIIGGMILGNFLIENEGLEISDIFKFLVLFILLHVIRVFVVFLHYPIFKWFGYSVSFNELIVIILAGLKGVISITLALIVYHDEKLDHYYRLVTLFFAAATAGFSIIFDSMAVKEAARRLGIEELTVAQENMLVGVTTAIIQHTAKDIEKFKGDKNYSLVRWNKVANLSGSNVLITQILKSTKAGAKLLKKYPKDTPDVLLKKYTDEYKPDPSALTQETRRRFLTTLKRLYWHEFESGNCLGFTSLILIDSANRALDHETEQMEDWEMLENSIYNHSFMKFYSKSSKIPLIGRLFSKRLYENITIAYDAARTFIRAHHEAEELLDLMEVDIDKEVFHDVMKEAEAQVFHCKEFVKAHIIDPYPEIIAEVQTLEVSNALLVSQKKLIKKVYRQGLIQEIEYENLAETIDNNIKKLSQRETPKIPGLKTTLQNRFFNANEGDFTELLSKISTKTFQTDDILFSEGSDSDGAYLIISGRVQEQSS